MKRENFYPTMIISLLILSSFGIIAIGHLVMNRPLLFLNYVGVPGTDYLDFFRASSNIINGRSPYAIQESRYVTTPIPAILNIGLAMLGYQNARAISLVLIPLTVILSLASLVFAYNFSGPDRDMIWATGLICILFGYPFYFLLERGNIDGWVILFIALGLLFLQKWEKTWVSGFFFSLAIVFKLYPLLIFLPFVLYRKWRLLLWLCIWLLFWGVLMMPWAADYHTVMVERVQSMFRFDENGSIVATMALLSLFLYPFSLSTTITGVVFSPIVAALVYGILISIMIYADYKKGKKGTFNITDAALYFPFMVALPQISFHYSFIICILLIPVVYYMWVESTNRRQRIVILVITIGISLTQWQAIALYNLTQNIMAHIIPGLGLLIIMVGASAYKLLDVYSTPR